MSNRVELQGGQWLVSYDGQAAVLSVRHGAAGIAGQFRLEACVDHEACRILASHDGVLSRLCLQDVRGLVRGYVSFHGDGGRLFLRCVQCAGQWLAGSLKLSGELEFPHGFACRIHGHGEPRVVQFGSGPTDGLCNDGIFNAGLDCCLWFAGASELRIRTVREGSFALVADVRMEQSGTNELVFTLERNFYGARCVPYYSALNKERCSHAPAVWLEQETSDLGARILAHYGLEYGVAEGRGTMGLGLRKEAAAMHELGLKAGLLTDWTVGDEGAGARPETMRSFCRCLSADMGYDMVLLKSPYGPPWGPWLDACREGLGAHGVLWPLGGHYTGVAALHADVSGALPELPPELSWDRLLCQARLTLSQLFVHGIVFWLHTGLLSVGEGLSLEEARVAAVLVALPGQAALMHELPEELAGERMGLLKCSLPAPEIHPMDLYPLCDLIPVWNLKVRRFFGDWDVVALFNWGEEEDEIGFSFGELGWEPAVRRVGFEFFTECGLGCHQGAFGMVVPAHGVRLVAFHDLAAHPQFLSSNRHFSQGGTDLEELVWQENQGTLEGGAVLVGGHETVLSFHVPAGYVLTRLETGGSCCGRVVCDVNGILRIALRAAENVTGAFRLVFGRE